MRPRGMRPTALHLQPDQPLPHPPPAPIPPSPSRTTPPTMNGYPNRTRENRILQTVYLLTLPVALDRFGDMFTAETWRMAEEFGFRIAAYFAAVSSGAKTVVHGDFRADNLLFDGGQRHTRRLLAQLPSEHARCSHAHGHRLRRTGHQHAGTGGPVAGNAEPGADGNRGVGVMGVLPPSKRFLAHGWGFASLSRCGHRAYRMALRLRQRRPGASNERGSHSGGGSRHLIAAPTGRCSSMAARRRSRGLAGGDGGADTGRVRRPASAGCAASSPVRTPRRIGLSRRWWMRAGCTWSKARGRRTCTRGGRRR